MNRFEINQTLHGYDNGHRLLSASFDIPTETRRLLLSMSDMSGPRMAKGFETYTTGYPLNELNSYAFAKTWYAPERPRPGCVWTHTLVIDQKHLVEIPDLRHLHELFLRPTNDSDYSGYKNKISYAKSSARENQRTLFDSELSNLLASFYYSPADRSVFVIAKDSSEFEDAMMHIWNTQWPALKKTFSFSTGSIASRNLNGKTLDLQQIPLANAQNIRRELPNSLYLGRELGFTKETAAEVDSTKIELLRNHIQQFHKFITSYCGDITGHRELYRPLMELFIFLAYDELNEANIRKVTDLICETFPNSSNALTLKTAIFGMRFPEELRTLEIAEEVSILYELLTTSHYASFDPKDLGIREHAARLWENFRSEATRLLERIIRSQYNVFIDDFLDGIAATSDAEDVWLLSSMRPNLLSFFVAKNPSLAYADTLWLEAHDKREEILDALLTNKSPQLDWKPIIESILNTRSDELAEKVISSIGRTSIDIVLSWFNRRGTEISAPWSMAVASQPDGVVGWLRNNAVVEGRLLLSLMKALSNQANQSYRREVSIWLNVSRDQISLMNESIRLQIDTFLISVGLDNSAVGADDLVVPRFESIHGALAREVIPHESWRILEKHLPELSITRNWDKCERLRRAFVRDLIENKWPIMSFFRAGKNEETFYRMCHSCKRTGEGKLLLKDLQSLTESRDTEILDFQRNILAKL